MSIQLDLFRPQRRVDYTYKFNRRIGRHGWLRLTPAYSVKLVKELIEDIPSKSFILDPFSGTGTTGLVAAENGHNAHLFDINPFLVWLGNMKCQNFSQEDIDILVVHFDTISNSFKYYLQDDNWFPPIHNIKRWWSSQTLKILSALRRSIVETIGLPEGTSHSNLIWIAFCRLIIDTSSAAFNHVSMSFHDNTDKHEIDQIEQLFELYFKNIISSLDDSLTGKSEVFLLDSRNVSMSESKKIYTHVITSPPYPNRISYIRELRPYMYWTGFLNDAKSAGEIDWEAIGGTWGIATSRLNSWEPPRNSIPESIFSCADKIKRKNEKNSDVLSKYVLKYFYDMHLHLDNLREKLKNNAKLMYIVGNSSFYGSQVHTEELLSHSLHLLGYKNISSKIIRKRNTKKELFEYCVFAEYQSFK